MQVTLLGGVAHRFPSLRFSFLEGGVGWACTVYADLIGHWEKRNTAVLKRYNDPRLLDQEEFNRLVRQYGSPPAGQLPPTYAGVSIRTLIRTIRPRNGLFRVSPTDPDIAVTYRLQDSSTLVQLMTR